MKRCYRWLLVILSLLGTGTAAAREQADELSFDRTIAALLTGKCLDCHNSTEKEGGLDLSRHATALAGGESGPAIMPHHPDESLLIELILSDEMPPKHPLTHEEKSQLRDWIAAGAKWGTDPIDPFRYTSAHRAGYDWWALQPVSDREPPRVDDTTIGPTIRNPIDAFVVAKLQERGLAGSPEADRRTLIRRVTFDLLGLPPSAEATADFIADNSPDAYERVVDRLLASPAYGERWTRHWLDVARFGESQGFERDKLRTNAWRYRDWVIAALNRDLPYDEFVRLQLAGDVLHPDSVSARVATGFLVAGAYDEVGQSQQSAAMKAVVRQDELEDLVSVVGQTFLGLTINCARCHDHKFDPVTQREYYQLTAALGGVRHGQPEAFDDQVVSHAVTAMQGLAARIQGLQRRLDSLEEPIRQRLLAERQAKHIATELPKPIARWEFDKDFRDSVGALHGEPHGAARIEGGRLILDGDAYVSTAPLTVDLAEKTLEAWVAVGNLDQRGGGVVTLQSMDGGRFDAIVFGEREPRRWLAGSNNFVRTQDFTGPEETATPDDLVHVAVVYASDGTITGYRNGQRYGTSYPTKQVETFRAGTAHLLFGLRHSPPGGNRHFTGAIYRAQLYDRALTPEEVAASAGTVSHLIDEQTLVSTLPEPIRIERQDLLFELEQLRSQQARYNERTVYAVAARPPEPTHVLVRGNPGQPAELVTAAGIASLSGVTADFQLASDAPDAARRIQLANWITDRRNPLFARVLVNRLWHYHFGIGIVDTPNDLGFNGGRPTHPELIDWLANQWMREEGSIKAIQRLMVTSAVYRQSSRLDTGQASLDAGNRYLWRKTPLRLDAETLRDTMLAVADELNPSMYGPGYHDFRTFTFNSQFYEMLDPIGATFQRRSLYRTWVRSGRSQFLDVFDCPDPSALAPQRAVTTTPLQALSLLNNSFVLRMADRLAARVKATSEANASAQVRHVFRLAVGREPGSEELAASSRFVEQHGLPALCRVIFNSNEFLYVD